ncbi:hypothetical protein P4637_01095 [Halalkalibacterium halodurans]|jgi:hypothetical protein|uniref:BH1733 protein n=1 Tax=Halalkalibacterium halodurans (strain ATCC BAA-125 / DSM 18197 / FERM 7344 / JCM 9153 / C-125) TaxID=272558 RepID=Q9KC41_HALH5|nr:hypothetical protein [Halalkalibacterium halodurans]MDY7222301.1 hypothetical protein [Halalkalibacterium halodurans]MDY7241522.1 hypothetical protein [Halalkalibacterium halodurans]MED4082395.1 hypothetical protein [Halalkalibacterium halodurans]MED4083454.1 hypothetical protein [Halalkalibacterium halodurans]MED4105767.1 hypothetical protein [Halalkalibacterium halodurans]
MTEEIIIVLIVFGFFLMTGVCGGLGVFGMLTGRRKLAKWGLATGFAFIAIYVVFMFMRL